MRAWRRQHANQGSFVSWTVVSSPDQTRLDAEDVHRANTQQNPENNRCTRESTRTMLAEQERTTATSAKVAQEQPAEKDAEALLSTIEDRLEKARWRRDELDRFLEGAAGLDERVSSAELKAKLHLALGLLAWYVDTGEIARAEFVKAKRLGASDCKTAVPRHWTPGSIAAFNDVTP
jgi:hypothetical protein